MHTEHYAIAHGLSPKPRQSSFPLHTHDAYEIYMFIEGDVTCIVENKGYHVQPYDIIVIRKHELHQIYHNRQIPYRRISFHVSPSFFVANHCTEYETHLLKSSTASGNKIPAALVRSSGLYDAFMRFEKYSDNFTCGQDAPVLTATLVEILYLLSTNTNYSGSDFSNATVNSVISYLSQHYTEDITLDELAERFFTSKYHLCRIFRKFTGLSIQEYICTKRLFKAKELIVSGTPITDAAIQAGFHDYTSFYRAYKKEYGGTPKEIR